MPGRPQLHESPDPGPHLRLSVKQLPWLPRRRDKSRERPAAAHGAEPGAGDLQYYNSFLLLKEEEGSVECRHKAVMPVENIWITTYFSGENIWDTWVTQGIKEN